MIRSSSREFGIPFQIKSEENGDAVEHVELLYSDDGGAHWHLYGRTSAERGSIPFKARRDGEFWFVFRTLSLSGAVKQPNPMLPQMRVLIETGPNANSRENNPETSRFSPQASGIGFRFGNRQGPHHQTIPVTPPKPIRATSKTKTALSQEDTADPTEKGLPESVTDPSHKNASSETISNPPDDSIFHQTIPVSSKIEESFSSKNRENQSASRRSGDLPSLKELFTEISQLYGNKRPDLKSVHETPFPPPETSVEILRKGIQTHPNAAAAPSTASAAVPAPPVASASPRPQVTLPVAKPASKAPLPPGRITKVDLKHESGQVKVVVRWSLDTANGEKPQEKPTDRREDHSKLQVDILRGRSALGPWTPIVLDYTNSGEYWWHVSESDLQPFYIAIRSHGSDGLFGFDTTRQAIRIEPAMLKK